MNIPPNFERHTLDAQHSFYSGWLPAELVPDAAVFEDLWYLHPEGYHQVRGGHTARWQQAYGIDYYYTGRVNKALPIPPMLTPFLTWTREKIDPRLNGILLNWYDGTLGHHIGAHSDSTKNMVAGAPIVTISLGEERIFRVRPLGREEGAKFDFPTKNGAVFIMPYETNLAFKHEVPAFKKWQGRRISVTLRGFEHQAC